MSKWVELVVHSSRNRRVVDSIKTAIRKAGGMVKDAHTSEAANATHKHYFLLAVNAAHLLPKVAHAVETLPGVAVTAMTEPGTPKASRNS